MAAPILAAYYPSWKIYKGCKPSDLRLDLLDHVCYAFARINDDGTIQSLDAKADFQLAVDGATGCIAALTKLRQEASPRLRVLLSVGGGSGSKPFPTIAGDDQKLHNFCQSTLNLLQAHELDGVDVDWEHPTNPQEGELFVKLVQALRSVLPRPRYLLTAALPAGEWCLRNIDLPAVLAHPASPLDYLHVMAYDFAGPWTGMSGHHAQLHAPADPPNAFAKRSIAATVKYLVSERSLDPSKLIIGIPAYGRSFNGVNGPGENFTGHSGDADGTFEYRDLPRPGTKEEHDEERGAAWCHGADGWISYDCPASVRQKCQFVKENGLGGIFFWTGSSDARDEGRSLVIAGSDALKH